MSEFTTWAAEFIESIKQLGVDKANYEREKVSRDFGSTTIEENGRIRLIRPEVLKLSSLNSLIDFYNRRMSSPDLIFLCSPQAVGLVTPLHVLSNWEEIKVYAEARPNVADLSFIGKQMDQETAVIKIRTSFAYDEQAADLLATLGTIMVDESITTNDDGVSQNVVAKSGISMAKKIPLGSVYLRPYETFAEVLGAIPSRLYNVRVSKQGGEINISLHASKDPSVDSAICEAIQKYIVSALTERGIENAEKIVLV